MIQLATISGNATKDKQNEFNLNALLSQNIDSLQHFVQSTTLDRCKHCLEKQVCVIIFYTSSTLPFGQKDKHAAGQKMPTQVLPRQKMHQRHLMPWDKNVSDIFYGLLVLDHVCALI